MKCEGIKDYGSHKNLKNYSQYQFKFKSVTPQTHSQLTLAILVHLKILTLCRSNLNPYCLGRKAAFFSVGI
jgi:hypothetical protein